MILKNLYNNIHAIKREKGRKSKSIWNIAKDTSEFPLLRDINDPLLQGFKINELEMINRQLDDNTSAPVQQHVQDIEPVAEIIAICVGSSIILTVFTTIIIIMILL